MGKFSIVVLTFDSTLKMSDQEHPESLSTDKSNEVENTTTRQFKMPQDIRYSTEQDDRDKLMKKYENYQISDSKLCIVRFLIDHRQKRKLFDLQTIEKTFDVNLLVDSFISIRNKY